MPADNTLSQSPSPVHGNGNASYPCSKADVPPGGPGFINYGYCRTSLDSAAGSTDPRCPKDCKHKAPATVVEQFNQLFLQQGAQAAAAWAKDQRGVTK
ncbi:hypothetical protein GCM10027082_24360 [Comamonas humi]